LLLRDLPVVDDECINLLATPRPLLRLHRKGG